MRDIINRQNLKATSKLLFGNIMGKAFVGYVGMRILYEMSMAGISDPHLVRPLENNIPVQPHVRTLAQTQIGSNQINTSTESLIRNNDLIPDNLANELINQLNSNKINPITASDYINAYSNAADILSKTQDYAKVGRVLEFVGELERNLIIELAIEG